MSDLFAEDLVSDELLAGRSKRKTKYRIKRRRKMRNRTKTLRRRQTNLSQRRRQRKLHKKRMRTDSNYKKNRKDYRKQYYKKNKRGSVGYALPFELEFLYSGKPAYLMSLSEMFDAVNIYVEGETAVLVDLNDFMSRTEWYLEEDLDLFLDMIGESYAVLDEDPQDAWKEFTLDERDPPAKKKIDKSLIKHGLIENKEDPMRSTIRNLEMRIARLEQNLRTASFAMEGGHRKLSSREEKQVQGKDFVLRVKLHPSHNIQLTEMPSKGVKTVRHIQWSNLGWLVQNYSNMFMVENLFRDLNKFSRMDFNKALKTIEDKLIEAGDIVVADYPKAEGNVARNTSPYETTLKSVEVKPLNYREISVRGKGFSVNCEWDRCTVSLDSDYDEYMAYNEGMSTFYVTKTHASARKMWKLVDAMGERGVLGYRTGEDFLEFLNSKRVGMRYVPTVWR